MSEYENPLKNHADSLDDAFAAETAFTHDDINRAIAEEERLGVRDVPFNMVKS